METGKYRDELWENAKHIAEDVRRANSIYAYYPTEYYERRKLQDMAVAHCFNLHDSLLEVAEDLPVTLEKVMPVIDEVKKRFLQSRIGEKRKMRYCRFVWDMWNKENVLRKRKQQKPQNRKNQDRKKIQWMGQ